MEIEVEGGRYMNTQQGTVEDIDPEDDSLFSFYVLPVTKRLRRSGGRLSHSFDSLLLRHRIINFHPPQLLKGSVRQIVGR